VAARAASPTRPLRPTKPLSGRCPKLHGEGKTPSITALRPVPPSLDAVDGCVGPIAQPDTPLGWSGVPRGSGRSPTAALRGLPVLVGLPACRRSTELGHRFEDHDGGFCGSQCRVGIEVLVDLLPLGPQP